MELLNASQNGKDVIKAPIVDLNAPAAKNIATITQKTVKPLVLRFLAQNPKRYTTNDIFMELNTGAENDKELRTAWIQAISLSLNNLVSNNIVNAYPYSGRIKQYIFKNSDKTNDNKDLI